MATRLACLGWGGVGWQSSAVEAVRLERIDASRHEVTAFRCGDPALDHWLHDEASSADLQAGTSVRVATNGDHVIGCYRLCAFQLEATGDLRRRTGERPPLPAILISRLGVDLQFQNRGIGEALLWHALTVAESAALLLGVRVVVAHAVGERATGFCSRFGFRPFESDPERLYLLTQDISASAHAC